MTFTFGLLVGIIKPAPLLIFVVFLSLSLVFTVFQLTEESSTLISIFVTISQEAERVHLTEAKAQPRFSAKYTPVFAQVPNHNTHGLPSHVLQGHTTYGAPVHSFKLPCVGSWQGAFTSVLAHGLMERICFPRETLYSKRP